MDRALVTRAQGGDDDAFATLADAVTQRFRARARRILRDGDLADDAAQRALLAIWLNLPRLRDPESFDAWSRRVLVHACYSEGRRARAAAPSSRRAAREEDATQQDASAAVVDRDAIERGLRRLSTEHRAVVMLHHWLDWPVARIAGQLGIPAGTVRSRLHHGRRMLRAALDADARPPVAVSRRRAPGTVAPRAED